MKTSLNITGDEVIQILMAAAESNGYEPTSIRLVGVSGEEVAVASAVIECGAATLKVRCAPESELSSMIRKRQEDSMAMLATRWDSGNGE